MTTTLTAFKQAAQLPLEDLIIEAEAVQETVAAICGRCAYRRRQMCVDSIQEDREMCPIVREAREAAGRAQGIAAH